MEHSIILKAELNKPFEEYNTYDHQILADVFFKTIRGKNIIPYGNKFTVIHGRTKHSLGLHPQTKEVGINYGYDPKYMSYVRYNYLHNIQGYSFVLATNHRHNIVNYFLTAKGILHYLKLLPKIHKKQSNQWADEKVQLVAYIHNLPLTPEGNLDLLKCHFEDYYYTQSIIPVKVEGKTIKPPKTWGKIEVNELFDKGDYPRIAKLANKHYSTVVQTLVTGTRHNKEIIEVSQKYYEAKRNFLKSIGILSGDTEPIAPQLPEPTHTDIQAENTYLWGKIAELEQRQLHYLINITNPYTTAN